MNILLLPLLAAILQAASLILHKIGLSKKNIPLKEYVPSLFLFLTVYAVITFPVLVGLMLQAQVMSPVVLFALRTIVMFGFFSWYYKTSVFSVAKEKLVYIGLVAILGAAMMRFKFYGLRDSGIAFTSLILILVPIIVFVASAAILREKVTYKHIMTIVFVLLSVLYSITIQV